MNEEADPKSEGKADPKSKDKADPKSKDDAESSASEPTAPPAPPWGKKVLRAFLFTFLGTLLTALLFADPIPSGLRVHFDFLASFKLGLIAGFMAALIRAVAAMLPVFDDDTVGRQRGS